MERLMLRRVSVCVCACATLGSAGAIAAPPLDPYGGYMPLSGHNTSGYFRVEKIGDRYYLVTPDNHAFISMAFDTANFFDSWGGYCPTLNSYPNPYGNWAKYNKTNSAWQADIKNNAARWGFNGFGAWCQQGVANLTENVVVLFITHGQAASLGIPWVGPGFVDVFDPRFVQAANSAAASLASFATSPYRIGAFPDNEIGWCGGDRWGRNGGNPTLPDEFIQLSADKSGKQYWAGTFLPGKYATIDDVNSAYGTSFTSFAGGESTSAVNVASLPTDPAYPAIFEDKKDFAEAIADRYYSVCTSAMRSYDPNHLVFSSRWALWTTAFDVNFPEVQAYNERIWKMAGQYCDIIAINTYHDNAWLDATHHLFSRTFAAAGKPFMVTEWASMGNDTQFAYTSWWGQYQRERGEFYFNQMKTLMDFSFTDPNGGAAHPCMGAQWFQYYDEPSLGRPDGERVNFGLLNVKDEPYQTALDVMGTFNEQVYDYVVNGEALHLIAAPTAVAPASPPAVTNVSASSQISDWERSKAVDNNTDTTWSTSVQSQFGQQYIRLDFAVETAIGGLIVTPRTFNDTAFSTFPVDFRIQYSNDGATWRDAPGHTYDDYPNPRNVPQFFGFSPPLAARMVRIVGTEFGTDDYGTHYMQLAEINAIRGSPQSSRPQFRWSAPSGAARYTLLYSPEKCFPEGQTIRLDGLTGTSYTPDVPLASGLWYWCARAVDSLGYGGKYSNPVPFYVAEPDSTAPTLLFLDFEDVSAWRNVSIEDNGWEGTVWSFRDAEQKTAGDSSARVVFTVNSVSKLTNQRTTQTSDTFWRYAGPAIVRPFGNQIRFDLRTARAVDSTGVMTVASKFLSLRVTDGTGTAILDTPLDSAGALAPLTWQALSFPLATPHAPSIATIELCVDTAAAGIPWDQRLTVWIDNLSITPAPPPSDFDGDGDVDLPDFVFFQACFNGPNRPASLVECTTPDLDDDADVDLGDFAAFQACFNGPNRPAACP